MRASKRLELINQDCYGDIKGIGPVTDHRNIKPIPPKPVRLTERVVMRHKGYEGAISRASWLSGMDQFEWHQKAEIAANKRKFLRAYKLEVRRQHKYCFPGE